MSFDISGGIPANNQVVYNNLVITLVRFGTFAAPYLNCFRDAYSTVPSQLRTFTDSEVINNATILGFTNGLLERLNRQDVNLRNLAHDIQEVGEEYENFVKQSDEISMSSFAEIRSLYSGNYFTCFQRHQQNLTLTINSRFPLLNSCYSILASAINKLARELSLECYAFRRDLQKLNGISGCNREKGGRAKADCVVKLVSLLVSL